VAVFGALARNAFSASSMAPSILPQAIVLLGRSVDCASSTLFPDR
jgi:hypothetical protein